MYLSHPLIKENVIEYRSYQLEASKYALREDTLIVLPTGTGKTIVALIIVAEWLHKHGEESKVIFMAPTKPLLHQHETMFKNYLKVNPFDIAILSGETPPQKRSNSWNRKIIFATPQVVYNDLIRGYLKVKNNLLLILDEAHRAVGSYPYVKIIHFLRALKLNINIRVVALTASPGDKNKTLSIMNNLGVKKLYILSHHDYKIKKYFYGYDINPVFISGDMLFYFLLELIRKYIQKKVDEYNALLKSNISTESDLEKLKFSKNKLSYTYIDEIKKHIDDKYLKGELSSLLRKRLKRILYLLTIADRLLTYLESYSFKIAYEYLQNISSKAFRKASLEKEFIGSTEISEIIVLLRKIIDEEKPYPKLTELRNILREEDKYERAIIFASIKNVANEIKDFLIKSGIKAEILIGQRRREGLGLSQREQLLILNKFKTGAYKVLIATQIGEEGLDISEVDYVIFYDNPISAIRRIQRMGRTGRRRKGKVFFLVIKNTRDESRYWAGLKKEYKLYKELKDLTHIDNKQDSIDKYIQKRVPESVIFPSDKDTVEIIVDYRERSSDVINFLKSNGFKITINQLPIGDYLVGNVIIERKSMSDLFESIIDGRLFSQLKRLKDLSEYNPLIVVEGNIKDFIKRSDIPTFVGTILTIIMDYKLPLYISSGPRETYELIKNICLRIYGEKRKTIKLRMDKKPYDIISIQKFVLAGIPGIDNTLAERLLKHFKNIRNIANATPSELMKVKGIGPELANKIFKVFHSTYST